MRELIEAIALYLTFSDIYDRTHTEQARKQKERKRAVLNHVLVKYQKAQQQAEQLPLTQPEQP